MLLLKFTDRYEELITPLLDKYGVSYIKLNTSSDVVYDLLDKTTIGTITGNPIQVPNWDGTDVTRQFNGNGQYVTFNKAVLPYKEKTVRVRFKYTRTANPTAENRIFTTSNGTNTGMVLDIMPDTSLRFLMFNGSANLINFNYKPNSLDDFRNKFNSFHVQIDNENLLQAYLNNELILEKVLPVSYDTTLNQHVLVFGSSTVGNVLFGGIVDDFQVYNKALSPYLFDLNYSIIKHGDAYYTYSNRKPSEISSIMELSNRKLQFNTIELDNLKDLEEYYE